MAKWDFVMKDLWVIRCNEECFYKDRYQVWVVITSFSGYDILGHENNRIFIIDRENEKWVAVFSFTKIQIIVWTSSQLVNHIH